jgi:hypothetical protein
MLSCQRFFNANEIFNGRLRELHEKQVLIGAVRGRLQKHQPNCLAIGRETTDTVSR